MSRQAPYLTEFAREIRKNPTYTEKLMWRALRNRKQDGLKFRREHPIEGYIVDFYCHEHNLVIEIDGSIHDEPSKRIADEIRQKKLEESGYRVLRFTTEEININIDSVIETILHECKKPLPPL
ncbi:MAG: endonuclease domain-containing protein [Bacteroidota bacterium]|nr:endonuclease domain-containing protein [Bacteroidota bacterium]MDP4231635.1 endonuclease domain-containing protein [Bacteroidota bacterium]